MKRLTVVVFLLAACGTDDPSNNSSNNSANNTSNNTSNNSSNNTSNNSTNNGANNPTNNATNNSTNNSSNNTSNNSTNNSTNNATNNSTNNGTNSMDMDMGSSDGGMDAGSDDAGMDMENDTGSVPSGEVCASAIPLAAGQSYSNHTTVGADDDYSASLSQPNCPNNAFSGGDLVYVYNGAAGEFKVVVTPVGNFDPALIIRTDCGSAACFDGTILNGPGTMESLTFTAAANTDYFIIVDGEIGDEGAYSISLEAL